MIEGIETGYEGKYDFPQRTQAPELVYLLASVPRTGSTWLSHLLWQTGCLGAPLEYLNFEQAGPYGFANRSPSQQQWLWRSVLRRRTSPNGVFGLKCFPDQLEYLQETNPELLTEVLASVLSGKHPPRVIWLRRRDHVAHAISLARAMLSGVWRQEQERGAEPRVDYSEAMVEQSARSIEQQERAWQHMFRDVRVEPLELWYEDAVAATEEVALQVAQHLGVELILDAAVAAPPIAKQAESDAREWRERYTQAKAG
ncbi:MAG TPA: Stf0 family sulfotransferase [Sphingomicrobium sp.]|nr:Stf0 family sulfotransferase [Sphingomicrobium sp.]